VHDNDYDKNFALVVKMDSIHLALSIVATKGWEVHQMCWVCVILFAPLALVFSTLRQVRVGWGGG
jgi:hypothetical protein